MRYTKTTDSGPRDVELLHWVHEMRVLVELLQLVQRFDELAAVEAVRGSRWRIRCKRRQDCDRGLG